MQIEIHVVFYCFHQVRIWREQKVEAMMLQEKMDARNREEAQEQRLMEAEKEKKRRAHEKEKVTKLFTYQIMSYIQQFKTKILQTHTCIKQIYCFNQFCRNIPAKNFYEPIKI